MQTDRMKIKSKIEGAPKTVMVFIRITPEMNQQLMDLAKRVGGGAGVATIMRDIVESALAEGIEVTGQGKRAPRKKNGKEAHAAQG